MGREEKKKEKLSCDLKSVAAVSSVSKITGLSTLQIEQLRKTALYGDFFDLLGNIFAIRSIYEIF